jgi:hypothetical protein
MPIETVCSYLTAYLLYFMLAEGIFLLFPLRIVFIQITVEILKDKMQFFLDEEYFFQFCDVSVTEFSESFDLAKFKAFLP